MYKQPALYVKNSQHSEFYFVMGSSLSNKAKPVQGHFEDTLQKKTRIQRETADPVLQKCDRSCQLTEQVQQKLKINSSLL
jgi:hypothetical protein